MATRKYSSFRIHISFRDILFFVLALAIYTEVPLSLFGKLYVPAFVVVFSLPLLFVCYFKSIGQKDILYISSILLILVVSALMSPGFDEVGHKLIGVLQTVVSISAGVMLFKLIDKIPAKRVQFIIGSLVVILVFGSLLEVVGLLRGLSDAFRNIAYGNDGYLIYDAATRDINLAGFVRPNFFTSEPSLLAIGFYVFACALLTQTTKTSLFIFVILSEILMLYIVRSPIIAISIIMTLLIYLILNSKLSLLFRICTTISLIIIILAFTIKFDFFGERIDKALNISSVQVESSENMRLVFPYITMIDVLKASPLWGSGISGKSTIMSFASLNFKESTVLGTNNFAALFTYLGIIGATLFLAINFLYFNTILLPARLLVLALLTFGLSQSMGAFESPRFWGYIFLFAGVLNKNQGGELKRSHH